MTPFSKRLKILRLEKNLTSAELAESIGESKENYEQYESGKKSPSVEAAIDLAACLGVEIYELTGR